MNTTLKDFCKPEVFNKIIDPVAHQFLWTLTNHGEVILHLDSGKTWAVHLGDSGKINVEGLIILDNKASSHYVPWSKIESMETHVAHQE